MSACSGVKTSSNLRFLIWESDISMGTVPCSTMSKSVEHGGVVGNHTLHFSFTWVVSLFANEKVTCDGSISHFR